jgi:hypothetical protein
MLDIVRLSEDLTSRPVRCLIVRAVGVAARRRHHVAHIRTSFYLLATHVGFLFSTSFGSEIDSRLDVFIAKSPMQSYEQSSPGLLDHRAEPRPRPSASIATATASGRGGSQRSTAHAAIGTFVLRTRKRALLSQWRIEAQAQRNERTFHHLADMARHTMVGAAAWLRRALSRAFRRHSSALAFECWRQACQSAGLCIHATTLQCFYRSWKAGIRMRRRLGEGYQPLGLYGMAISRISGRGAVASDERLSVSVTIRDSARGRVLYSRTGLGLDVRSREDVGGGRRGGGREGDEGGGSNGGDEGRGGEESATGRPFLIPGVHRRMEMELSVLGSFGVRAAGLAFQATARVPFSALLDAAWAQRTTPGEPGEVTIAFDQVRPLLLGDGGQRMGATVDALLRAGKSRLLRSSLRLKINDFGGAGETMCGYLTVRFAFALNGTQVR